MGIPAQVVTPSRQQPSEIQLTLKWVILIMQDCQPPCRTTKSSQSAALAPLRQSSEEPDPHIVRTSQLMRKTYIFLAQITNDKPVDVWYTSVQNLPVVWPDLSMLGSANLRKVIGHDFHEIRTKINALGPAGM